MNRAAQPGGWKVANYYTQIQRTRRIAKTPSLGYRIRSYRSSPYFPSLAGHGTPLPVGRAKILGISIILIGLVLGGYFIYQGPSFHPSSHFTGADPYTLLWGPTNSSTVFKHNSQSSYAPAIGCSDNPYRCETLQSSQATTAVILTNTTIGDLSVVNGKNLVITIPYQWCCGGVLLNPQPEFGWYITTNSTIPTHAIGSSSPYNPYDDPSVVVLMRTIPDSTNHGGHSYFYIQQGGTPTPTIDQQDTGCTSGSRFICGQSNSIGFATPNHAYVLQAVLNFTGAGTVNGVSNCNASGFGSACSFIDTGDFDTGNTTVTTSSIFPRPVFQTGDYYFGIYQLAGVAHELQLPYHTGGSVVPCGNSFCISSWIPPANAIPPQVDTSGFFGIILKGIVIVLTIALAYLMQFLGYVWTAMQIGLDAVGNFLGLGPIGTAITNAFVGVATWITSVLGSVFSNVGNIATSVGSAISAVGQLTTNFFNGTNGLGAWLTQLGNMAAQFWGVMGTLGLYGKVGVSFLLAAWMLWGAVLAEQDVDKFWNQWYRTTGFGFLWVFKVLWWSGEAGYGIILKIKSLIWPTGSGGGIVQAPA